MPREIVTLQLGNYANFVGTHWWNVQQSTFRYDANAPPSEIDHDVLFREGQTMQRNVTFTPRVLMLDRKGALKHMPEEGELYGKEVPDDQATEMVWPSDRTTVVNSEEVHELHPYQQDLAAAVPTAASDYNFADTVHDWIDYSRLWFHPRSINLVRQYTHSQDDIQFDTISSGMELWRDETLQDELTDRIRQYVEECDSCQGFQVLFDCTDGFAGIAVRALEYLGDEYGKATLVFPLFAPRSAIRYQNADQTTSSSIRVVNTALAFSHLADSCSLFVPLSTMGRCWRDVNQPRTFPQLSYGAENYYQTSAVLASFLDTVSLRYRLKDAEASAGHSLMELCVELNQHGRMAAAGLGLPFPMNNGQDFIDCLNQESERLYTQLTPNVNVGLRNVVQSVCLRGIPKDRLKRPETARSSQQQQRMAAYRCDSISSMLQFYYDCHLDASRTHVSAIQLPLTTADPYPKDMFAYQIDKDGFSDKYGLPRTGPVESVPSIAMLQTSSDLSDGLDSLHREVSRIKIAKIPRFAESNLEPVEYAESLERLLTLKENYDASYTL